MDRLQLSEIFKKHFRDESSFELVIQKLKDAGASMMECTRTLLEDGKIPLMEADSIVIHSKAWGNHLNDVKKLRDEIDHSLETLSNDEDFES
jgi:hypothetical protein